MCLIACACVRGCMFGSMFGDCTHTTHTQHISIILILFFIFLNLNTHIETQRTPPPLCSFLSFFFSFFLKLDANCKVCVQGCLCLCGDPPSPTHTQPLFSIFIFFSIFLSFKIIKKIKNKIIKINENYKKT